MTRVHAVLPAAGRAVRFGSGTNKIFADLLGRTIIERTVAAFIEIADEITIVAGSGDIDRLENMVAQDRVHVTLGGQTRQDSVWNGLLTVEGDETIVLVHDAARPLVTKEVIDRCLSSVEQLGSGVAAVPIFDALKSSHFVEESRFAIADDIDRTAVWAVQTPQAFPLKRLLDAHKLAADDCFVGLDESSLVQRLPGETVYLVPGDRSNIKITTTDDLCFAENMLKSAIQSETRNGIGYDIHRLVSGRPLWLGGVSIPSEFGLDGHSDADVLLHAICDSLLGAAGLSDIGHRFPNTDEQFRGISSIKLLANVFDALADAGWSIVNVDTMVIAELPRIAPYINAMKEAIAPVLRLSMDRISIKATTNEGIGSLGSGQGIACHALATIIRSR